MNFACFLGVFPKLGRNMLQVRDIFEATVKIGKYRLNLVEIDNHRRHKTKKIEGHLMLRKFGEIPNFSIPSAMELFASIRPFPPVQPRMAPQMVR